MKHSLLLIMMGLIVGAQVKGQQLVMKDGTRMGYEKMKFYTDYIEIKDSQKKTYKLENSKIKLYYKTEGEWYARPKIGSDSAKKEIEFLERKLEGKINVYERVSVVNSGTPGGSLEYDLFLEKGSEYVHVFNTHWLASKKDKLEVFKRMIQDYAELSKFVTSEEFKFKYENVLDVIKKYNLDAFEFSAPHDCAKGSVFFYSRIKRSKDEVLTVTVNDSEVYTIPPKTIIPVTLCTEGPSKVCFSNGTVKQCELLSGSSYYLKYFEVEFNAGKGEIQIEKKTSVESQKYLVEARSH